jgi:hypothetical protein
VEFRGMLVGEIMLLVWQNANANVFFYSLQKKFFIGIFGKRKNEDLKGNINLRNLHNYNLHVSI